MKRKLSALILAAQGMAFYACSALALSDLTVSVFEVLPQEKNSIGKKLGTLHFEDTEEGLKISPNLQLLSPGPKGFHIHQQPSCESGLDANKKWVAAGAAGDHLDPKRTGKHLGPINMAGHLGDLPTLQVNPSGIANRVMVAPKLKVADILNHSIVIHKNGDNYSDHPEKLGGGGPRIACGVLK